MERIRRANTMSASTLLHPLLLLLLGIRTLAICPPMCSCSRGHRVADCSSRGLSLLPDGLQHNIHFLNLSHNRLQDLDGLLAHFSHLRTLDISHNHLQRLPTALPRSLWDIRASDNRIRQLEKNDTAYHWNLQVLDLAGNQLERVVLINNTLPSLQALNLSHNKFWTVPTNMPHNLEVVDLSHNFLLQILPGSLDRLPRLERFYLHANKFPFLSEGVFDKLEGLQIVTLGDNPWACEDEENITHLLRWAQQTTARVLGCPCYTRPTCGEAHLTSTGIAWHSASYTEPPLGADARRKGRHRLDMQAVTSGYLSKSVQLNLPYNRSAAYEPGTDEQVLDNGGELRSSTAYSLSTQTSTTVRSRGAPKRPVPGRARSTSNGLHTVSLKPFALNLLGIVVLLRTF